MKVAAVGVWLATGAVCAMAQAITGAVQFSHDSDSFNEGIQTIGYTGQQGWGVKAGALQYTAPGWSADGTLLAATFIKDSPQRQINASLGLTQIARRDHVMGGVDYLEKLSPTTSLGLSAGRDFVNSIGGIQSGITYDSLAVVADHAFTDRFNVGATAGSTLFSNDNNRLNLRTRWNYALHEGAGLNVYIKTRNYQNSNPYRAEYFSPNRLGEASLGLSVRFPLAQVGVLSASMDAGRQRIDGASEPIWSASVGLASRRGSAVQWMVGGEATNSASQFASQVAGYRYASLVARVSIPF
ncbi:MAG: hypothetical protein KGL90_06815 [Burkholderiales bacterium]|nr:hypothetical protein [Burkholderiales bacterium]